MGIIGHATSEFVAVLSATRRAEVSVWCFMIGGLSLLAVSLALKSTRNLIQPLRERGLQVVLLSVSLCLSMQIKRGCAHE